MAPTPLSANRSRSVTRLRLALLLCAVTACAEPSTSPAEVPESTARMAARLNELAERIDPSRNLYANDRRIEAMRAAPPPSGPTAIMARGRLVEELLKAGRTDDALGELDDIRVALDEMAPAVPARIRALFEDFRSFILLRAGQEANCIGPEASARCRIGPHGPPFGDDAFTEEASRRYLERLEEVPEDRDAAYYLNIAAMRLGRYPDGVPERWRIDPAALGVSEAVTLFPDRAPGLGLDVWSRAGGSVLEDFDGDGDLDLMISSWGPRDQMRYFENEGSTFVERTEEAGLTGLVGGLNMVQADYDNDGLVDVLVLRGGWFEDPFPNSLLRNLGEGRFRDVTVEAGLGAEHSTQTAAWADFDGDGWIDLLIGNETHGAPAPAELYRNNGDGTFTDVAAEVGLDVTGFTKAVLWGDVDGDGRPDAFFSRLRESNLLFMNRGPGEDGSWRFEPVDAGVEDFAWSFPAWFFDYDNDGHLDLFVNGWRTTPGDLWLEYRGLAHQGERARLYRNRGDGTFSDVSAEAGVDRILHTMGSNFGDIDNDGFPDFYVGTGEPDFRALMPSRMFRNVGGERFEEVTASGGFGYLFKGHGVSFGDVDGDGDQDIHVVFGGAHQGDTSPNVLLENPGNSNGWVTLRLVGVRSNRSAIGARVMLRVRGPEGERRIHGVVGSGGSFGASSLQQEIGLGDADEILEVVVEWPGGETETFTGSRPGGVYTLEEGSGQALPAQPGATQ